MKLTHTRRIVAAIATAGLVLVGTPALAPANAASACALGATCNGSFAGSLGNSPYEIRMPKKFNGTVLIYDHGYRIASPLPAAIAGAARVRQGSVLRQDLVPALHGLARVGCRVHRVQPGRGRTV